MQNTMTAEPRTATVEQPPIILAADEHDNLVSLAQATLIRFPASDAQWLMDELYRANTVPAEWMPEGVVGMDSYVEFTDDRTGRTRRVQLVYPYHANISSGRISVLSRVGAPLIGLAEGQTIGWAANDGRMRRLTVLRSGKEPLEVDPGPRGDAS
ncbi:MAG: nucleoside diphosphate kinase regulator [Acetobacteraceae bacterium]